MTRKAKTPRKAETYRGARRNAARGLVWRGIKSTSTKYVPPVRLNRSRKWPDITRYAAGAR